jgi:hypothetical protein
MITSIWRRTGWHDARGLFIVILILASSVPRAAVAQTGATITGAVTDPAGLPVTARRSTPST